MDFIMSEHGFETQLGFGKLAISVDSTHGFRPYQLLVSAIATCSGGLLLEVLRKRRIDFNDMRIHAQVTRNETGAREVTAIHLHFTIVGAKATDEQLQKSLKIARKNCSMVQSVKNSITVTETVKRE